MYIFLNFHLHEFTSRDLNGHSPCSKPGFPIRLSLDERQTN